MTKYLVDKIYTAMLPIYQSINVDITLTEDSMSFVDARRLLNKKKVEIKAERLREEYEDLPGLEGLDMVV